MTSAADLAKLSDAVYGDKTSVGEWLRRGLPYTIENSSFKSALYQNRQTADFALAIAGTSPTELDDLKSDYQLAMGRMPDQYRVALSAYAAAADQTGGLVGFYLTGHSLGGGLASMLAKQFGDPLVTFNAPGMARAFADLQANNPGMGVARDEDRKVLHICAFFDIVSRATGSHMGEEGSVRRIPTGAIGRNTVIAGVIGTLVTGGNIVAGAAAAAGATALTAHGITRLIPVLENSSEYSRPLDWL
ncbi:MAG: hypothetical protein OEM51_09090 [Gammaproteobacteria bacterium]|nr:hypothetical protein [Gammaproteobacteria bacterium]MDH3431652.1 hypothetical protein [Gammaproteobacteria bacterium]